MGVWGDSRSLAFETESTCLVSCIPLQGLSWGLDLSLALGLVSWCSPQEPQGRRKKESRAEPVPVVRPSPHGREGKCRPEGGLTHGHLLVLS